MTNYIGEYACKVDAKSRILMPAGLMKQFPAALRERFVINRSVFQKCLVLYTMDLWDETLARLNKLNRFNKDNDTFIRLFNNGAILVEVDTANRILLPKRLSEYAGIQSDIIMSSNLNKIEIWAENKFDQVVTEFDTDSFSLLAEKVMGSLGNDAGDI